jgi:hypothetical protein
MGLLDFVRETAKALRDAIASLFSTTTAPSTPTQEQPRWRRVTVMPYDIVTPDPPPMHWAPCSAQSMANFKASMTCPNGHGLILRNHRIASDGAVFPSVVCPNPQCDFHEFVQLEGWHYGAFVQ